MKTPKEYSDNLKKGIITDAMLSDALYSVNKRAKNWRDKKREYSHSNNYYYWDYSDRNRDNAEANEQKMYSKKEKLLSVLKPICIHKELVGYETFRIYDTDKNYWRKMLYYSAMGDISWVNSFIKHNGDDYWDDYNYSETWFFDHVDKNKPKYNYYLYYILGEHSYHKPIDISFVSDYDLDVVEIDHIITGGKDIDDLISVQFVDKLISLIEFGEFVYEHDETFDNYVSEKIPKEDKDVAYMNSELFDEAYEHYVKCDFAVVRDYELEDDEKISLKNEFDILYDKYLKNKITDKNNFHVGRKKVINKLLPKVRYECDFSKRDDVKEYVLSKGLDFDIMDIKKIVSSDIEDRLAVYRAKKKYINANYNKWIEERFNMEVSSK